VQIKGGARRAHWARKAPGRGTGSVPRRGACGARVGCSAAPCTQASARGANVKLTAPGARPGSDVHRRGGGAGPRQSRQAFPWMGGRWGLLGSANVIRLLPCLCPYGWIRVRCVCHFPSWEGPPFHLFRALPFPPGGTRPRRAVRRACRLSLHGLTKQSECPLTCRVSLAPWASRSPPHRQAPAVGRPVCQARRVGRPDARTQGFHFCKHPATSRKPRRH
jgi:hypothetical protein